MLLFFVYYDLFVIAVAENGQLSRNASSLFQMVEPGKLDKESTMASGHSGWEQESVANTARQLSLLGKHLSQSVEFASIWWRFSHSVCSVHRQLRISY